VGRLRWASAILATGLLLLNVSTAWAAAPDPVTCALQYLASGQATSGAVGGQPGVTADYIFGAAAAGFDPTTLKKSGGSSVFAYLEAGIGGSLSNAALVAKETLAAVDGKLDPTSFGGNNLLTALDATYDPTTHAYGDAETYTQSLAILALTAAADAGHPLPAAAVTELIAGQDSDGSWDFQGVKDAAGGGDTNSTAVALEALAAAGTPTSNAAITGALAYLHAQQLSDGGFPYNDAFPPAFSDPDSDANVIQGLLAAGEDPGGAAWTKGGHTVLTNILTFQSSANGGFIFPGNPGPDAFTTSQVPAGIKEVPFPGSTSWTADATLPAGICAAAIASGGGRPVATPPVTATAGPGKPGTTDTASLVFLVLAILASLGISLRIWSRRLSR
jgi:hypothetical protein